MEIDEYRRMAAAESSHWWYAATRALLEATLAPHLRGSPRILDAGCGTGAAGGWLARRGAVVGTDIEPLALTLYREARPRAELVAADLARLPFASASFDAALCVTVLYHRRVVEPESVVRELARVLRTGGVLCFMEPAMPSLRRAHDRITHTARRFSRAQMRALLHAAGLTPLRVTGAFSFLLPPAYLKAAIERGSTESDLEPGSRLLGAALSGLAGLERRWLVQRDLPVGLSWLALAVKEGERSGSATGRAPALARED
jgi:SAM-dependent methyltransferase